MGAGTAYHLFARPRHLRWGATDEELTETLPGDDFKPDAEVQVTHAITIDAPAAEVWKWLVQIGQGRGGFYSYTWLENLIGADIHNVERLIPDLPDRRPGDIVWMGPRDRFGGMARMVVGKVERERTLVLVPAFDGEQVLAGGKASGVWSFVLDPLDDRTTRLIMLSLFSKPRLAELLFWEPAHFVMERKMMLTLKRLAETTPARQA